MNLEELLDFITSKKQEFHGAISAAVKEITFEDVKSQIKLDPSEYRICGRCRRAFEDEQIIRFIPPGARYQISISRDELTLEVSYDLLIKRFTGEKVTSLYDELSAQIKKIQETEDVTF